MFCFFLGISIYFVLLFLFREFKPTEKQVMKKILAKYLFYGLAPKRWKVKE
jgi:hypothetical protein